MRKIKLILGASILLVSGQVGAAIIFDSFGPADSIRDFALNEISPGFQSAFTFTPTASGIIESFDISANSSSSLGDSSFLLRIGADTVLFEMPVVVPYVSVPATPFSVPTISVVAQDNTLEIFSDTTYWWGLAPISGATRFGQTPGDIPTTRMNGNSRFPELGWFEDTSTVLNAFRINGQLTGNTNPDPSDIGEVPPWPSELPSPVPIPATVWLFGTGLLGLAFARRKQRPGIPEIT